MRELTNAERKGALEAGQAQIELHSVGVQAQTIKNEYRDQTENNMLGSAKDSNTNTAFDFAGIAG